MMSPLMVAIAAASSGIRYYGLQDLTNTNSTGSGGTFAGAIRGGQINLPTATGSTSRYTAPSDTTQHMGSGSSGGFDWSKTVILSTRFRMAASPLEPGHVIYILLGSSSSITSGLFPDATNGVGVRINDNMTIDLITQAGALATFVSVSGGTIAVSTPYDFTIVSINGLVRLYINGVLAATTSAGPTTPTGLGALRMSAELTAATAAARYAYSGGFTIYNGI